MMKDRALSLYGGDVKPLADALGVSTQVVSMWKAGQPIPERYALRLLYVLKPPKLRKADVSRHAKFYVPTQTKRKRA